MIHNPQKAADQTNISRLSLKTDQIRLKSQFTMSTGWHQVGFPVWTKTELNSTFNSDKERLILDYWWGL